MQKRTKNEQWKKWEENKIKEFSWKDKESSHFYNKHRLLELKRKEKK